MRRRHSRWRASPTRRSSAWMRLLRTAGRMLVTHKRLLEWNPSSDPDRQWPHGPVRLLPIDVDRPRALPVAAAIYLALSRPAALAVAAPILGLWFASPAIAWWISRPLARRRARLTADQTVFLRKLSRKTWAFFETFVGPEDHWLPPDNYQEHPVARDRASHVADQHGTGAAGESVRLRLRLHFRRTTHRAHGEYAPHDGNAGTVPRPLLQLVRHAVSETAAASLRLDRGQRQSRRPSADTAARACWRFPIRRSWGRDCSTGSPTRCGFWWRPPEEPCPAQFAQLQA